jgi:hypothetical protein
MPHSTSPIGTDIQYRESELRRIPLLGTSVNKPRFGLFAQKFIGNSSPLASNEAGEDAT